MTLFACVFNIIVIIVVVIIFIAFYSLLLKRFCEKKCCNVFFKETINFICRAHFTTVVVKSSYELDFRFVKLMTSYFPFKKKKKSS